MGKFKLINKVDLKTSPDSLVKADVTLQYDEQLLQYEWENEGKREKKIVEPGVYTLVRTTMGVDVIPIELKERKLLDTATNTSIIMDQAHRFFTRLHVYDGNGIRPSKPKKRAILLTSGPGMGKTATIEKVSVEMMQEDPKTLILVWPTGQLEGDHIADFFMTNLEYKDVSRLVLIIEDIGGSGSQTEHYKKGVDTGMLNFLDGVGVSFVVPTFIIATTNNPGSLAEALADRPGRFDRVIELKAPKTEERLALMKFLSGRELTEREVNDLTHTKGVEELSIAHLQEIVFRSELEDVTFGEAIDMLINHKKKFKKNFADEGRSVGFGGFDD